MSIILEQPLGTNAFDMGTSLHGDFPSSGNHSLSSGGGGNPSGIGAASSSVNGSSAMNAASSSFGIPMCQNAGIRRMKRNDGPTNFYRELEMNAESLQVAFPHKDKYQLMKLLEDLDNRTELAQEILFAEHSTLSSSSLSFAARHFFNHPSSSYSNNNNNTSISSYAFPDPSYFEAVDQQITQQNAFSSNKPSATLPLQQIQQPNHPASTTTTTARRILTNIKPKAIKQHQPQQIPQQLQQQTSQQEIVAQQQQQQQQQQKSQQEQLQQQQQQQQTTLMEQQRSQAIDPNNNNTNNTNQNDGNSIQHQNATIEQQEQQQVGQHNIQQSKVATNAAGMGRIQIEETIQSSKQQQQQLQQQQQTQSLFSSQQHQQEQQLPLEDKQELNAQSPSSTSFHNRLNESQQQRSAQGGNGGATGPTPSQPRVRDLNRIYQHQKHVVDSVIIPQLIPELNRSSIESAPQILAHAFKYYEDENRKTIQYDRIIPMTDVLIREYHKIHKRNQVLENQASELTKQNELLNQEKDKYKGIAENLAIMFHNNNTLQANVLSFGGGDFPPGGFGGFGGYDRFCH